MKKFLWIVVAFFGIPLLLLLGLYLWTDPFRTLHAFDIKDVNTVNREYVSTELYLRNKDSYHYNSFVFGSSQAGGLNTYTWKMYLPEGASTFMFQEFGGNITGVKQKIEWLDKIGAELQHVLIFLDMPAFFSTEQNSHDAIGMKHYMLAGEPEWVYHAYEYYNFIQSPLGWIDYTKQRINGTHIPLAADSVTNDFFSTNRDDYQALPKQDSLNGCSEQTRRNFFLRNSNVSEKDVQMAPASIDESFLPMLQSIKSVFDKQGTDYCIIITPTYRYTNPYINTTDLELLQEMFGKERVYDFSSRKEYTSDYNDYWDPVHFGRRLGWYMLREVYTGERKE